MILFLFFVNVSKSLLIRLKLLLILSFGIFSCSDLTTPTQVAVSNINKIFEEIEFAFQLYEPERVISRLHPDFLHNGYDRDYQALIWYERLLNYHTIVIEKSSITVNEYNNYAEVEFELTLIGADTTIVSAEPSPLFGDLSYFSRFGERWFLYGNQH